MNLHNSFRSPLETLVGSKQNVLPQTALYNKTRLRKNECALEREDEAFSKELDTLPAPVKFQRKPRNNPSAQFHSVQEFSADDELLLESFIPGDDSYSNMLLILLDPEPPYFEDFLSRSRLHQG